MLIYNDQVSSFQDIIELSNERTNHQQYLESLGLSPHMSDLLITRENLCNLRNFQTLYPSNKRTVKFGIETITYRDLQMWKLLPNCLKAALFFKYVKTP